jgi:RNA polymerase sigma-70 factor (sigma-E family)
MTASPTGWDEDAVVALYQAHFGPLVRLAALLVGDTAMAEDVVQDCFVALHGGWQRLRAADQAVPYLRQSVVNRSRSVLRHRAVANRHMSGAAMPEVASAEDSALESWQRSIVASALGMLPTRQREALVLRYYAGLPNRQAADAMGISEGAVKRHVWRGVASLRAALEAELAPSRDGWGAGRRRATVRAGHAATSQ